MYMFMFQALMFKVFGRVFSSIDDFLEDIVALNRDKAL